MMEESFALGESFSCYEDGNGFPPENPRGYACAWRERPDISSVLVMEEDEDDDAQELEEVDDSIMYELERQAQKLTLKPQTSSISVESREG
jgi:hypothetical protein